MSSGYTGLSFPFRIGSKGRVVTSTTSEADLAHIKESIKQILLTNKGERVNEPEFGANLINAVFESIDETITNVVSYKVTEALQQWEPRIEVGTISVVELEGGIEIVVEFTVISTLVESITSVIFERSVT